MACRMPYTINISIIHIIIQYFFVLNKFSVLNLLQNNDCGPQTSKQKKMGPSEQKGYSSLRYGLNINIKNIY